MDLSLPANNLSSGIAAFENGADSIYFGLTEFSARKTAENFTFDDFCRIKEYAISHSKKIYIAFNTIVNNEEMERAYKLLKKIDFIGIDGLIVQDFGIVNLCKREFPAIPLHASTQMAVLNKEGVLALKELGFKRVVLARELSLSEIEDIRKEVKDIELKVFVHGALCYCISGLCYASYALTDGKTSANKGSCTGVCRWPFKKVGDSSNKYHFPFSLSDVESDKYIIEKLQEIGIDAIKVEGRLKNSIYAANAASYYRAIIDKKNDDEIQKLRENLECAFSRKTSSGYFYTDKQNLDCSIYTGHRGYKIGTFVSNDKVHLLSSIHLHDGLFYIDKNGAPIKFASPIKNAKCDDVITLHNANAEKNTSLYKIKKADENEKKFNKEAYKPYQKPIDITFIINSDNIKINEYSFPMKVQKANKPQDLYNNIKSAFSVKEGLLTSGRIKYINNTELTDTEVFIPLSTLKNVRREFYKNENERILNYFNSPYIFSFSKKPSLISPPTNSISNNIESDNSVIKINNIGDILPFLNDKNIHKEKTIIISPLLNVANEEATSFFSSIFEGHNIKIENSFEIDKTNFKNFPIFTSLSNLPESGEYTTQFKGKTFRVKVIRENGLVKTYLL